MEIKSFLPAAVRKRLDPEGRYGLRVTLFALALVIVTVPFALILDQVVASGPLLRLDTSAANRLHDDVRQNAWLVSVLKLISFLGWPPWFWVLGGGVALNLWIRDQKRLAIFLLTTTIVGSIINTIVKNVVNRDRPSLSDPVAVAFGKSFPSGHTMSSTIMYGAILLIVLPLIPKRRRPLAIAATFGLVGLIGFSRLALGVHFITDVLGGIALGTAWLVASTAAFEIWRAERGRRPVAHPMTEGVDPAVKKIGTA